LGVPMLSWRNWNDATGPNPVPVWVCGFDSHREHRGAGTGFRDFLARRLRRVRLPVAPPRE